MSRRKTWSKSEKLEILDYAEKHSVPQAARKYGLSSTAIYKWINKLEQKGIEGLESRDKKVKDRDVLRLERENRELKAIVAEKELQIRIQAQMLKKSH